MAVHILSDGGLAAAITMLLDKTVIDASAGVMLLSGSELVLGQPPIDDGNERSEYRSYPGLGQLVTRRTGIPNGCSDRAPVMVTFPSNLTYTFTFNEKGPANLLSLVHFKHPFPPVTGFLSSIPDSIGLVGAFSPITDL
jgi:hypothetical protein